MKQVVNHSGNRRTIHLLALLSAITLLVATPVRSATIWNGPIVTYIQPGTDATDPANQDRLTADVWLTRNGTQGLFNAFTETFYTHNSSPENTEWAYGELANYTSLSYTNWEDWNGRNPPSMVGQDAVLHLVSDDIYLSIQFTDWAQRGGTFSYNRSSPGAAPPPPPSPALKGTLQTSGSSFQLTFTNLPGYTFTIRSSTNLTLAATNWTILGQATDSPSGSGLYQFTDTGANTNQIVRFYEATWP